MHSVNIIVNNANHFRNVWECVVTEGMYFGVHFFWKTELGNVIHFIYDAKYWSISLASVFLLVGIFLKGFFSWNIWILLLNVVYARIVSVAHYKIRNWEREREKKKLLETNSNQFKRIDAALCTNKMSVVSLYQLCILLQYSCLFVYSVLLYFFTNNRNQLIRNIFKICFKCKQRFTWRNWKFNKRFNSKFA